MSGKKYNNVVRTLSNELADIAKSNNQQKAVETKLKKAGQQAVAGTVGLTLKALGQEEAVNKAKDKIENFIEKKLPYTKYAVLDTKKIGIQYGDKTFNSSFTMNKDGNVNLKLNKTFKNNLSTELEADKKNIKLGLKLDF
jgi:ATP-dependent protease HslVU (ClpYQ) ATPase subunit